MKVILVLGAAVWQNGASPALLRRCNHAQLMWERDPSQYIIPCGGVGAHPPSEAAMMQTLLKQRGVPAKQILCEDKSRTTYENIRNAHAMLAKQPLSQMIIVSDRYHLPRAYLVARHFGHRARLSGPSFAGTHMPTQARHVLRELVALPLYALKLIGHTIRGID